VAAEKLRSAGCDLIVMFLTTYMTASMVLPIAQRTKADVLVLNLQPTESMDHATSTRVSGSPIAAPATARSGKLLRTKRHRVPLGLGYLADERAWTRIERWIQAAGVRRVLRNARHGSWAISIRHVGCLHGSHTRLGAIGRSRRGARIRRPSCARRSGHRH